MKFDQETLDKLKTDLRRKFVGSSAWTTDVGLRLILEIERLKKIALKLLEECRRSALGDYEGIEDITKIIEKASFNVEKRSKDSAAHLVEELPISFSGEYLKEYPLENCVARISNKSFHGE